MSTKTATYLEIFFGYINVGFKSCMNQHTLECSGGISCMNQHTSECSGGISCMNQHTSECSGGISCMNQHTSECSGGISNCKCSGHIFRCGIINGNLLGPFFEANIIISIKYLQKLDFQEKLCNKKAIIHWIIKHYSENVCIYN